MSVFKDAIKRDVKSVFLNTQEFGETHTINGKSVACVFEQHISAGLDGREVNFEGVYVNTITLYVAPDDLDFRPVRGQYIKVDDETYMVMKVGDEYGVLAIVFEVNEQ